MSLIRMANLGDVAAHMDGAAPLYNTACRAMAVSQAASVAGQHLSPPQLQLQLHRPYDLERSIPSQRSAVRQALHQVRLRLAPSPKMAPVEQTKAALFAAIGHAVAAAPCTVFAETLHLTATRAVRAARVMRLLYLQLLQQLLRR